MGSNTSTNPITKTLPAALTSGQSHAPFVQRPSRNLEDSYPLFERRALPLQVFLWAAVNPPWHVSNLTTVSVA